MICLMNNYEPTTLVNTTHFQRTWTATQEAPVPFPKQKSLSPFGGPLSVFSLSFSCLLKFTTIYSDLSIPKQYGLVLTVLEPCMNGTIICIHLFISFIQHYACEMYPFCLNAVVVHPFALTCNVPLLNVPQFTNKFYLRWLFGVFVVFIIAMPLRKFLYLSSGTQGSLFLQDLYLGTELIGHREYQSSNLLDDAELFRGGYADVHVYYQCAHVVSAVFRL